MDPDRGPGAEPAGRGDATREGQPAPRPRRRRSLRRLLSRFLLALGSRARSADSPPRPRRGSGDGHGGFPHCPVLAASAPGSPAGERAPSPLPLDPAGDGARPPGAQGLKNHGNTCFMNAVVQCLSNTDLLAEFLALGRYEAAPGCAEVTKQLAALVRALWTREYTPQLSAEFKNAVSKYGSQFQGNSQQDALEFLLWLLDRVHEDLDGASRRGTSEKLQPEASKNPESHPPPTAPLPLGQSFVQNHFQAQYRSSLTCPHCQKQSNTFDPFLCVSLPIPLRQTRFLSVTLVFPSKSQRLLRVGLAVPILSTVAALRKMVAEEGNIPADEVILAELHLTGFQRSFFDEEDLNVIADGDNVYAFHAPASPGPARLSDHPSGLPVSPRPAPREGQREAKVAILFCNLVGSGKQASRFGPPFLVKEGRDISWAQLRRCILSKVCYLMKREAPAQNLGELFSIRIVGLSPNCSYLSPQAGRPLCQWTVDRVLQLKRPGGPPHIKLAVEWEHRAKEHFFGSLQEEQVQEAESVQRQQQVHQQSSCTLDECFQFYTKEEQLTQDDAWKCPHCQVPQQGTVKLSLWTLPDILIIHLKRFCQVGERRNKLSTLVTFPLAGLNMAPHAAPRSMGPQPRTGPWPSWKQPARLPNGYPRDFLYDLYAVCNHHGSLQGGHYTAYCRNSLDGQWYSYDDSTVEPLREDEVSTRGAYILFYQKRNSIPLWSASSSMRGSTSSSISDHWLMRLGSNNDSAAGSLLSWASAPCPSLPPMPDSPIITNSLFHQEKGGLPPRPRVSGNRGRSISVKASTPPRVKQGPFKTMPLRWSFGSREKPPGASVELVEYLESKRRPRSTSRSIVPLLTRAAAGQGRPAAPSANVAPDAHGEDRERAGGGAQAQATVPHPNHCPPPGNSDGLNAARKVREGANQEIRLPRQFDLPLPVTPCAESERELRPRPEGQRTGNSRVSSPRGSNRTTSPFTMGLHGNSKDSHHIGALPGPGAEKRDSDGFQQGTLTLLRSVFWKKENKRKGEGAEVCPQGPPGALLQDRPGTASGVQARAPPTALGVTESLTRAPGGSLERDVRSAPSSFRLPRKASRHPTGSTLGSFQRRVPGEQTSYGTTLQRVKYHTFSLGRKKTLPESSF
ncbi:ubiquitin carboxyl-terminal hydrolase 43 [Tenrec ecaudatus]|uniref:ubiquitin carboxyl-terminal hydrolase 43 n=1 Tax=Tenrec ecaudatus TaxID=94439 RepID=UPI003F5A9263